MSSVKESDETFKQLTILVTSVNAYGHVNTSLGIGSILAERGHKVYYLGASKHQSSAEKQGITFIPIEDYIEKNVHEEENNNEQGTDSDKANAFVKTISETAEMQCKIPVERLKMMQETLLTDPEKIYSQFRPICIEIESINDALGLVVEKYKPDVIIEDVLFSIPFLLKTSIYHVKIVSMNPILLYPGVSSGSGLSVNEPKEVWDEYQKLEEPVWQSFETMFKPMFEKAGLKPIKNFKESITSIKDFGVYTYPKQVDYKEFGKPVAKWTRIDSAIRKPTTEEKFEIPDCLKGKPGKLVLFSAGTLASSIVPMMQALLDTLGKSPHRFIVSKGPLGDQLNLPDNCWGENYINQLAILPHVDLVIGHGGNNTFIETLAAGKPTIILPLFGDQPDNAQRVVDLGIGKRFWPFDYNEDEFLKAIDEIVNDEGLREKMEQIAQSIKESDSSKKFVEAVEELVRTGKSPI